MRLVFPVMLILLGVVLVGFLITNPAERVNLTVGGTQYESVPLPLVALIAMAVGVGFTAVVALTEGAAVRLGNRRLRREIQRLETELRFLRSQSAEGSRSTIDPVPERGIESNRNDDDESLVRAPVYDPHATDRYSRGE